MPPSGHGLPPWGSHCGAPTPFPGGTGISSARSPVSRHLACLPSPPLILSCPGSSAVGAPLAVPDQSPRPPANRRSESALQWGSSRGSWLSTQNFDSPKGRIMAGMQGAVGAGTRWCLVGVEGVTPGAPTVRAVCLRLPLLSLEGTRSQGVSPRSQAPLLEGWLGEENRAEEAAAGPLCPAPPSLCHGPQEHPTGSDLCFFPGTTMSGPQTPEPALGGRGASSTGSQDEDTADGIQSSHRMLSFSDALLSIIATVMVRAGPAATGGVGRSRPALACAPGTWRPGSSRCPAQEVFPGSCCVCSPRSCL